MSVTRVAIFLGIFFSFWMAPSLKANAFEKFVGLSDRGATQVRNCGAGKNGREVFVNNKEKYWVELNIDLGDGDGINADDNFDAEFLYFGNPVTPLFSGIWSKIDERPNGTDTYQLTPSGDLAALSVDSGWKVLFDFINAEAVDACLGQPETFTKILSPLIKGTLVVSGKSIPCDEGSCREATVSLVMKVFSDGSLPANMNANWVKFNYKAKGYVY